MTVEKKSNQANQKSEKKKRSRLGCRNCKLRGVKCDEGKPECKRCNQYGVVCSYTNKASGEDLQFSTEKGIVLGMESLQVEQPSSLEIYRKQEAFVEVPGYIPYWTSKSEELLNKFQLLTAQTISVGPRTQLYCTTVVDRSRRYPFMLNILKALTSMHLRSLSTGLESSQTPEEAGYCYLAVTNFAKEITSPRNPEHQAMLLCAASMIYNMTFANIEAKTPMEAWPLAPPSPADLGWLKLSAAKTQISQLVMPMGKDPLFALLSSSFGPEIEARERTMPPPALPLGFSSLFGLESTTNRSTNPYFAPAIKLGRVLNSEDPIFVSLGFIILINELTSEFKQLLARKDPRALLLLACWFAKLSQMPVWWYRQRSIIEGQAICMYLEKFHGDDMNLQVLLRYPKSVFDNMASWDIYPSSFEVYATSPTYSRTVSPSQSSISSGA